MMRKFFLILPVLLVTACDSSEATPPMESWLGKWNGPEGTYLEIARDGAQYDIVIKNLDGETRYSAIEQDGTLQFMRDEMGETIKPGTGDETGMKWLAGKQNCLVIKPGEGFCRD
jgi:hypothetical protein